MSGFSLVAVNSKHQLLSVVLGVLFIVSFFVPTRNSNAAVLVITAAAAYIVLLLITNWRLLINSWRKKTITFIYVWALGAGIFATVINPNDINSPVFGSEDDKRIGSIAGGVSGLLASLICVFTQPEDGDGKLRSSLMG